MIHARWTAPNSSTVSSFGIERRSVLRRSACLHSSRRPKTLSFAAPSRPTIRSMLEVGVFLSIASGSGG